MSDKRFVIDEKTNYKDYPIILDTKTGDWWVIQDTMMGTGKLLDLLNEQQSTIKQLESDKAIAEDYANIFEKENVKLRKQIDEQQATITELERKLKKYAKIGEEQLKQIIELQETETFTFPPNCDECDFLGGNGICGYCKFTLKCYDSKEDLIDGEVLPNCPLKPLINVLNEQQGIIEEKSNVIILMGAFIKSKGFSIDDFDEWISKDWHNVGDDL